MFFTVLSQLPFIKNDLSKRKLFKLFLVGSIGYIGVHHYLYKEDRTGLILKFQDSLYKVMAADLIISTIVLKFTEPSKSDNEDSTSENDSESDSKSSDSKSSESKSSESKSTKSSKSSKSKSKSKTVRSRSTPVFDLL